MGTCNNCMIFRNCTSLCENLLGGYETLYDHFLLKGCCPDCDNENLYIRKDQYTIYCEECKHLFKLYVSNAFILNESRILNKEKSLIKTFHTHTPEKIQRINAKEYSEYLLDTLIGDILLVHKEIEIIKNLKQLEILKNDETFIISQFVDTKFLKNDESLSKTMKKYVDKANNLKDHLQTLELIDDDFQKLKK